MSEVTEWQQGAPVHSGWYDASMAMYPGLRRFWHAGKQRWSKPVLVTTGDERTERVGRTTTSEAVNYLVWWRGLTAPAAPTAPNAG